MRYCVSLGHCTKERCISALGEHALCELRLDLLPFQYDLGELLRAGSSVIVTDRVNPENGLEAARLGARYVDCDTGVDEALVSDIHSALSERGGTLIHSVHDFNGTPDERSLEDIVESFRSKGRTSSTILKIATLVDSHSAGKRLLSLLLRHEDISMIVLGMGEKGRLVRLLSPFLGGQFTYVTLSERESTAPGQLTVAEFQDFERVLRGVL